MGYFMRCDKLLAKFIQKNKQAKIVKSLKINHLRIYSLSWVCSLLRLSLSSYLSSSSTVPDSQGSPLIFVKRKKGGILIAGLWKYARDWLRAFSKVSESSGDGTPGIWPHVQASKAEVVVIRIPRSCSQPGDIFLAEEGRAS